MAIVTIGRNDLAKKAFAVHCVDEFGGPALMRPKVRCAKLVEQIANQPPCLIGMKVRSGAHHGTWGFAKFGHRLRLMAPTSATPYRIRGKRGKNDAVGISDANSIHNFPL